jgi:hypothetical protein
MAPRRASSAAVAPAPSGSATAHGAAAAAPAPAPAQAQQPAPRPPPGGRCVDAWGVTVTLDARQARPDAHASRPRCDLRCTKTHRAAPNETLRCVFT